MPDALGKVATVAWRDFKYTVLTKTFIFGAIGVPFAIVGLIAVLSVLLASGPRPLTGTVALVDPSGSLIEATQVEFSNGTVSAIDSPTAVREPTREVERSIQAAIVAQTVELDLAVEPHRDPEGVETLKERVRSGDLVAVAVFEDDLLKLPDPERSRQQSFALFVGADLQPRHTRALEQKLRESVVRARLAGNGQDGQLVLAMLEPPSPRTTRLLDGGLEISESTAVRIAQEMIPIIFMVLLWGATFVSAQHLMMSTIEEKSTKVAEVLLSAVSPLQLMAGKILGQGLVGLIILGTYSTLGIAALLSRGLMHLVPASYLVYMLIFFVMAYFMIASVMAGVGSAVSEIRDANSLVTPTLILLFVPLFLWPVIKDDPNGTLATIFSFVPPATPFVMMLRVTASEPVPLWQIPLAIVWGYVCVVAMVWMSSRIFRVGVLMSGKPPTPLELLKWIRYS